MPTGGVNLDNLAEWFKAGVSLVGAGSNLTTGADKNDYEQVTSMAKKYHKELMAIRNS